MNSELSKEIASLATEYYKNKSIEELENLLRRELKNVSVKSKSATRGAGFWVNFRKRLLTETIKNRDTVSVTIGYATSQALNMLQGLKIDISDYKIVIALLVALVVRASFDTLITLKE